MLLIYFKGLFLGASLIIAIGLQNAFILKQGLKKTHVFAAALTASLCDAVLIGIGVLGFGKLITAWPELTDIIRYAGAAFLVVYGAKALLAARRAGALKADQSTEAPSLRSTILVLLGVSLLNPHVYLDTVVLVGGLSASYGETGKYWFGSGAMSASFLWFFGLAYGARLAAPLFARPRAWQILDIIIGLTMWGIAVTLLLG